MSSWETTWNEWLDVISQDIFDPAMNRDTLREIRKVVAATRQFRNQGSSMNG